MWVPSGIVSGLMGLAMSLRETSVKVPKIAADAVSEGVAGRTQLLLRASALGVEAGSCIALRSPQRRSLVTRGCSRATTTIKAAFLVVNAETPTQLCRDFVRQQRRWSGHRPLFKSLDKHISLGVVGRENSCSHRNCYQGGVGQPEPVTP